MIKFNCKELYEYLKENKLFVPRGSRNLIYKYDDITLLKINKSLRGYVLGYDEYLRCIEELKKDKKREYLEKVSKKIVSLKPLVKKTTLPNELVYVDDLYIGSLVTYFEGYCDIDRIYFEKIEDIIDLSYIIIDKIKELIDNGIYSCDFTGGNILVKNKNVELIDFDGEPIFYSQIYNSELEHDSYESYYITLVELIMQNFLKNKKYTEIDLPTRFLNYQEFKKILDNYQIKVLKRKLTK